MALLAAGVAGTGVGFGGETGPGPAAGGGFDVTAYDVTMDYRPVERVIRGVAVVSATAAGALDRFTLHLAGPEVRAVSVDGRPAGSFAQEGAKDLVVVPARPVRGGERFTVRVEYDGAPGDGWLTTESGGATAFEGASSAWFPAHEDVRDRAAFRLTATVPRGWSVIASGRPGRTSGATTFRWAERDVDPAHLAVSIDRFTVERSALADGTPVVNAYAPGLKATTGPLAARLPEVLRFLSARFGRYPFDSAGNVFVHVNDDGPGTAPQSRPVYLGAGNATYMNLAAVVHEQAHQWYGISAAPRQDADVCLSECFATYATWLWAEAKDGTDLDDRYRALVREKKPDPGFWKELYRSGGTPGFTVYEKGPLALHALRRQVGDPAFSRLLERWPGAHRGGYAGWPEFEAFAEQVTGRELTDFFAAWFRGATVPADAYLWPGRLRPAR
ncbi:peptidase M1-like protein [Pseudosporangium ferrugineum]|uniref:Peptidase M1-like protein n=1 Tax=Pseudosporangium ferrugineum TaxID=439699 RepID=A0A2T0SAZ6_9ACTN|nr:peptidase M1-like protein [Pseudosporangium ferrugineum]